MFIVVHHLVYLVCVDIIAKKRDIKLLWNYEILHFKDYLLVNVVFIFLAYALFCS